MSAVPPEEDDDPLYKSKYLGPDRAMHKGAAMELRLKRQEVIMEWLDRCDDPLAHAAMKVWVLAVLGGGSMLATGSFSDTGGRGFPDLHYAIVPGTGAMVVFYLQRAAPVGHFIQFVDVIGWP